MNYYAIGIIGCEKDARRIAMQAWGVRLYEVVEAEDSLGADGQAHIIVARASIHSAKKLARWYEHSAARIKEIDAAVGPEAIAYSNNLSIEQQQPRMLAHYDANRAALAGLLTFYKPVIENPVLGFVQLYWGKATLLALGALGLATFVLL